MNKPLLYSIFVIFSLFTNIFYSQNYNEADKEGVRKLLRQSSRKNGKFNFHSAGLTVQDTLTWYTKENWVEKTKNAKVIFTWEEGRLVSMKTNIYIPETELSGFLDCSNFQKLKEINFFFAGGLTGVDVSKNRELIKFVLTSNLIINELDVSNNPRLEELFLEQTSIRNLDVSHNTQLKKLQIENMKDLNLANNKELEDLNIWDVNQLGGIKNLDLSKNIKLKHFGYGGYNGTTYNKLTALDLSNQPNLKSLRIPDLGLKELKISKDARLDENVDINYNSFPLSTIYELYRYGAKPSREGNHNLTIDLGEIAQKKIIDFSTEYNFDNYISEFYWSDEDGNIIESVKDLGEGRFEIGEENIGKILFCQIKNDRFPSYDKYEFINFSSKYKIKIEKDEKGKILDRIEIFEPEEVKESRSILFNSLVKDVIEINYNKELLKVEIYDMSGNRVHVSGSQKQIPAQYLKTGIYVLKIFTKEGKIIKKKVIKK